MHSVVPGAPAYSVTTQPTKQARIGKFTQHSGRRLVSSAPSSQQQSQEKAKQKFALGNASIEEIDKVLEDDALALLNIRKEITAAQTEELGKIHDALLTTKREYDSLLVGNTATERDLQSLTDRYLALTGVDRATHSTLREAKGSMRELTEQTAQVLDDLAAEQRTIKMQSLMIKRLEEEIGKCRVESSKAMQNVETAKHDLTLAENSMQVNRQFLLEQENQLEKLQQTLKMRKDQRDSKITMLHNLSVEGESSVTKLQQSLMESSRRSPLRQTRAGTAKSVGKQGIKEEEEDEDLTGLPELSVRARRMNVTQIKEALQRFQTQTARIERLHQQEAELKASMTLQQKKKQELSEHLTQTQVKIQQLASSRQIYQEVDLKDHALAAASKEFEEAKERDFRLRLHLESLKQSVPRFLTKLTKTYHLKPNDNLLGDACLKLEDEVIKFIKVIASALLKDATQDDLALMSQQSAGSADSNSEFGRLQRLPGFTRMQKQLFFNMMTARQDHSNQNIRVDGVGGNRRGQDGTNISPRVRIGNLRSTPQAHQQSVVSMQEQEEEEEATAMGDEIPYDQRALGRDTIKNISRLIVDRDGAKAKAAAAAEKDKK